MAHMVRVTISLDRGLAEAFDAFLAGEGYPSRSEAVKHLISKALVEKEWQAKGKVAGVILMVYDHHKRDVVRRLLNVQHDHSDIVVSTQHVHLDHDNCLEVIIVKGKASQIKNLETATKSLKGMKHSTLLMTTAGGALA